MKGKKYYIAYGDVAALAIKNAMYEGLEKAAIVCFRDDFTQGPLPKDFDLGSIDKRKAYWNSLSDVLYNTSNIDAVLDYSIKEMLAIDSDSLVYLWTGDSAYDRLATMWLSVWLDRHGCVVYNNDKLTKSGAEIVVNLAMLSPLEIANSMADFEIVHPMQISIWKVAWKNLADDEANFRILDNDQILSRDTESMASYLLHYIGTKPVLARDLIEQILTEDPMPLSDVTVEYLLRFLISKGTLEYTGNLESMTDYSVFKSL